MRARTYCGAAALMSVLCACFPPVGAHGFDIDNAKRLGLGGAVALLDPGALDQLSAPTASLPTGYTAEAGVLRLYELAELDASFVAAAARRGAYAVGVGVQQFGRSNYYAEKTVRLTAARATGAISTALIGSWRRWEFGGGYGAASATSVGA
ncbi:MAG TPA: hypothetical protein VLB27_00630, partial [candidate division Zixibacteria bacterium]|nr:hypothetical protein [candidate division Zixibacteria bacterium]